MIFSSEIFRRKKYRTYDICILVAENHNLKQEFLNFAQFQNKGKIKSGLFLNWLGY